MLSKLFREKISCRLLFHAQGLRLFCRKKNQVLFNYDGKIFKCTTISKFNDENALGKLDMISGKIHWNEEK